MMKDKAIGVLAVGVAASIALGSIGVASAATVAKGSATSSATTSTTAQPDGQRDRGPAGVGRGFGGEGDLAEALAKLSGLTEAEIRSKRDAGTSYSAIASSKNVTDDALIAETVKIETAELDAEVKAGTLTSAKKTQILSDIEARLKTAIASTDKMGHGGHGRGPRDGHGSKGQAGSRTKSGTPSTGSSATTQ